MFKFKLAAGLIVLINMLWMGAILFGIGWGIGQVQKHGLKQIVHQIWEGPNGTQKEASETR